MLVQDFLRTGLWFEPAMAKYAGKATDARDFINQKREDNGDWPDTFLDYLIEKAGAAT